MADPDIPERLRSIAELFDDDSNDAACLREAADQFERLRTVFRAAVEFRRCYHERPLGEELRARQALLDAVSAALDGERRA